MEMYIRSSGDCPCGDNPEVFSIKPFSHSPIPLSVLDIAVVLSQEALAVM